MWPFRRSARGNGAHSIRSSQPYFLLRNGIGDAGETLADDVTCDVAIIGAGVTGALVADALVDTGLRIVMLERLGPSQGSTAATTALLQYEIDTHLTDLVQMLGAERAARAYRACQASFRLLERRYPELLGLADYERRESLYLAADEDAVPGLRAELGARQGIGIACTWVEQAELERRFGARRPGAILSSIGAQMDPVRFTSALLAGCRRHGVRIFERAAVERIDEVAERLLLQTRSGRTVSAAHVVVCAGYESLQLAPPGIADVDNTFALVTEPAADRAHVDRLPLVWESARPYLYVRGTRDGRVIAGGADVPFKDPMARELLLSRQLRRVRQAYEATFGEPLPPIAYGWAGSFARTPDGLPFIGAVPGANPRLQFALCFGGNGITYAAHAGDMIRAGLEGRPHALDEVFGFGRLGGAQAWAAPAAQRRARGS
jgi:glycine/D-amino acid oxidase-like deaminating enzyme